MEDDFDQTKHSGEIRTSDFLIQTFKLYYIEQSDLLILEKYHYFKIHIEQEILIITCSYND